MVRIREVNDNLWVRVLDVPGLFGARRYAVADELVVEVTSQDVGIAGRWMIAGSPDGSSVVRTRRKPDVTMTGSTLGAISLGGVSLVSLLRAGLIVERRSGIAERAGRFVRTDPAPLCTTHF